MNKENIVSEIIKSLPELPDDDVLKQIVFKWNKEDLSPWDGGYDLNEKKREEVVKLLRKKFETKNPEYAKILRFLLQQEIKNCYEGEFSNQTLSTCYDRLADLRFYEDIPLLLSANNDAGFDANCALYKDRLFYNGYENIMAYLKSNQEIEEHIIEGIQYYAEYFGYDKNDTNDNT